jgi:hypothetical protein
MQTPNEEMAQRLAETAIALGQRVLDLPLRWALLAATLLAVQLMLMGCLLVVLVVLVKFWQGAMWILWRRPAAQSTPPPAAEVTP